jgi:hypothetical protein
MAEIALTDQRFMADTLGHFLKLQALDNTWTHYLEVINPIPPSDIPALQELADTIDHMLETAGAYTLQLAEIFQRYPQVVEQAYAYMLRSNELTDEHKQRWQLMAQHQGGVVGLAVSAMKRVAENIPAERAELSEKMRRIESGEATAGDLQPATLCGIFIGMAVAEGMMGVWIAAIPTAAIAGSYCGIHRVFNGE